MKILHTKKFRRITVRVVLLLFIASIIWIFYGVLAAAGRFAVYSAAAYTFIIFATLTITAASVSSIFTAKIYNMPRLPYGGFDEELKIQESQEKMLHDSKFVATSIAVVSGILALVGTSVVAMWGGYHQGSVLISFAQYTDKAQPEYVWRGPFIAAERSVSLRTTEIDGDLLKSDTTFLPYINQYATPIKKSGFTKGLSGVVTHSYGTYTTKSCSFEKEVPRTGGVFNMNLNRALSSLDIRLQYNDNDIWAYCKNDKAILVVPVIKMTGFPQGHPVPAGVVLFDGEKVELRSDVATGELPGPVYPLSLAAAQRKALNTSKGFMDYLDSSGFGTSDYLDAESNKNNVTELLLHRKDGSGWDYVTPLTPNGKPFAITALATIPADRVTSGKLNEITVHNLPIVREGNQVLADRLKAAFPQLGWASGLQLVEVIPTSDKSWVGTLVSNQAVVNLVEVSEDGSACLREVSGEKVSCVTGYSNKYSIKTGSGEAGSVPSTIDSLQLNELSNEELAELAVEVANEQLRRTK